VFDDSTPIFMQLADQLCAEIVAGTAKDRSGPMEPYEALVCQVPRDGGE